jgi:hypothetical protein
VQTCAKIGQTPNSVLKDCRMTRDTSKVTEDNPEGQVEFSPTLAHIPDPFHLS